MITQMSLEHKSKKEKKREARESNFPSIPVHLNCVVIVLLLVSQVSSWISQRILFGLFSVETTGKDGSMEEPNSSQENKLHH